jgi:REP element-mobilizing transposase RayT
MSEAYKIKDQNGLYYLTLQVVYWIDIFTRSNYRDIIIKNLDYCQKNKGLEIYAYVIMSNHVHLLVKSNHGKLSDTVRDFKSYTSKQILSAIDEGTESRKLWLLYMFKRAAIRHKRNSEYQFWTHENHAEHIYSNKFMMQKLTYIHNNPVVAKVVNNPEEYLYSSARNYAEMDSVLEIKLLPIQWKTYS